MPSLGLPIYGQRPPEGQPTRWRSLAERDGRADPTAGQYPDGDEPAPASFTRRSFIQVLGASAALAGLSACKPPREPVVSYVKRPAGVTPSLPSWYATAVSVHGYALGLLAESHEGRPTKLEGHPGQSASRGAAGLQEQAALLDLYDPERISGVRRDGRALGWTTFLQELEALAATHAAEGGARLRFLVEPSSSPTQAELRRRLRQRFPQARFTAWDAAGEGAVRAGAALAFGRPLEPTYLVSQADVILALDSDFLASEGEHLRHARDFGARRVPPRMNRLYVVEPGFTVTGGMADHRFRLRAGEVLAFAREVAGVLAASFGVGALAPLAPLGEGLSGERARQAAAVAKDLFAHRGQGLVLAGRRQPPVVHAVAAAIDAALGNAGLTTHWHEPALLDASDGVGGSSGLAALCVDLGAGRVDTLVVTAWNPAYTAPADLDLPALLGKARQVIYLTQREDETSRLASTVVAATHPLEAWADARARDGVTSIAQPLVAPLHEAHSDLELLSAFVGLGQAGGYRLVRDGWKLRTGETGFDRRWDVWLAEGLVPETRLPIVPAAVSVETVAAAAARQPAPADGLEAIFAPDEKLRDGRFAGNAWLQELPHPISKLTWDNAALVSPATARRLGVDTNDRVALTLRGRTVEAPVLVQPGHADESVTLPLGYGRTVVGAAGQGVGFDAGRLRGAESPWFEAGLVITRVRGQHELAQTQEHFSMEGRYIAAAYPLADLARAAREIEEHRGPQDSLLTPVDYSKEQYRWGMAIDLSKCLGCGACTLACQAENNIPVVGKEQVLRSREMHWIRVDRYYGGTAEDPTTVSQPLACVHCEAAPCEYVCPVNATVHSDEGLNEMVYNRCVGTRYCSNNCAYKVRRFNYLDFHPTMPPVIRMAQNPDVTVRSRGVMEKCSYCVQRIERARIGARTSPGGVVGGDAIQSACQQACPSEAIVFGNLNDPTSRVTKLQADERRYDLLHELGTRPRTGYLVRVTNPNPELA